MSAINVLTFPGTFVLPQTCCEGVRGQVEMHVPVIRTPIVSARWTVEINSDGTRQLVERWSLNAQGHDSCEISGLPGRASKC